MGLMWPRDIHSKRGVCSKGFACPRLIATVWDSELKFYWDLLSVRLYWVCDSSAHLAIRTKASG